jgi:hypothetical protein
MENTNEGDAGRTDLIFVGCVFFFIGRRCPRPRFCGLEMGSPWVYQTLPRWLLLDVPGFTSRCPGAALFKMAISPSGLQVPVLFKTFGSHSYSASRGDQSGTRLCSIAPPRRGHLALALRLASTVHGFCASTLPISTAKASWGEPSMAGALPQTDDDSWT